MNKWILSDTDGIQAIRNVEGSEWEVLQIVDTMWGPHDTPYALKKIFINLDDYLMDNDFVTEYLMSFGYNSVDEIRKMYSRFSDQIIAECIAETEMDFCGETIKRGTFRECIQAMEELTGIAEIEELWESGD